MSWSDVVRAILFAIFVALTAAIATVTGPTYDDLLVPSLSPSALYPPIPVGASGSGGGFLATAAAFSAFLLGAVVDPLVALVGVGIGVAYLARPFFGRWRRGLEALVPKLVIAVVLANFTLPIAAAILDVAGSMYPVVAGFDGGAWTQWVHLAGWGEVGFSWDNGLLAFLISFVLLTLILLLVAAVAIRDALLGVLLVLLPVFTLLWPVPVFASLARRGWLLFVELSFLPCVLVVPLELAVGSPTAVLTMAYLAVAVSSPSLISLAGASLGSFGFAAAGSAVSGGFQRSLALGSAGTDGYVAPATVARRGVGVAAQVGGTIRRVSSTPLPFAVPRLAGELVGHGLRGIVHTLPSRTGPRGRAPGRFPPIRPESRGP